jgi:signal transduction histidine kinase
VLTSLIFEIGNTSEEGLLGVLNGQTSEIANYLEQLTHTANVKRQTIISESATVFIIISFILIVLSLLLTYFTSTRLARPIKKLSGTMGRFIVAEGLDEMELDNNQNSDEIRQLSQSFIKLSKKLKTQFNEILLQNRELKKLNDELDRFIYSAAHDLKSPLASLEGLLLLAQREEDINEMSSYFSMMKDSVKKLNGFIGDITDYAKNKRQQLKIERIDLQSEILEAVNSLKFLPEAERIDVQVHIRGEDFFSDRTRFEIVIKNLLSNSFRYMDTTKPRPFIRIDADVTFDDLRLSISDNGIGIAKEHVTRIFEMFYRAVEHSKGTGIGLFLVKESVKMLRGRVSVRSALGEYTIFHLNLPNFANGHANTPETEAVEMISA